VSDDIVNLLRTLEIETPWWSYGDSGTRFATFLARTLVVLLMFQRRFVSAVLQGSLKGCRI
jgi:L-rhamnose isomerase